MYISQYVIDECSKGDAAQRRLNFIEGLPLINKSEKIEELARIYQRLLDIPEKAKADSFHLAVCVDAKIDYLLSWNFNHLSFASYGLPTPFLITPEMLNTKE
ncbi:hypothetical protein AGMMS49940_20150 [Spirochaetia bacterium]|nr:hypothetical protein AGMMS49940_20150 [Spirochaetia bacterium]